MQNLLIFYFWFVLRLALIISHSLILLIIWLVLVVWLNWMIHVILIIIMITCLVCLIMMIGLIYLIILICLIMLIVLIWCICIRIWINVITLLRLDQYSLGVRLFNVQFNIWAILMKYFWVRWRSQFVSLRTRINVLIWIVMYVISITLIIRIAIYVYIWVSFIIMTGLYVIID